MKTFDLLKLKSCDNFIKQSPTKEHYNQVINEDCYLRLNGKIKGFYLKMPESITNNLQTTVNKTKFVNSYRTKKAINTRSSVFGFLPRNPMRQDYCRISESTKKEKNNFIALYKFSEKLSECYKTFLLEKFNEDLNIINKNIKEEWRFDKENPFTTISINVNHAIKYHKDTANYKGSYSNVLIVSKGVEGGELVLPEYKAALSQKNGFLLVFDGQNEIHGVMPIQKKTKNSFRASIVFYALENMKHCYPYKEEVKRIKIKDTERAKKRVLNKDPRKK